MSPKPKIEGTREREEVRNFSGTFRRVIANTRWIVSCPCHRNGEFAIAIVPSWEAALDIVATHRRVFHDT